MNGNTDNTSRSFCTKGGTFMSRRVSSILEIIVALGIFWIGINNMNFLFITGTRSAAITLGIIGLCFI